jgi:hypothetical protein
MNDEVMRSSSLQDNKRRQVIVAFHLRTGGLITLYLTKTGRYNYRV